RRDPKPYTPGHRDLLHSARPAIRDHRGFGAATAADGYRGVGNNSVTLSGISRARVRTAAGRAAAPGICPVPRPRRWECGTDRNLRSPDRPAGLQPTAEPPPWRRPSSYGSRAAIGSASRMPCTAPPAMNQDRARALRTLTWPGGIGRQPFRLPARHRRNGTTRIAGVSWFGSRWRLQWASWLAASRYRPRRRRTPRRSSTPGGTTPR